MRKIFFTAVILLFNFSAFCQNYPVKLSGCCITMIKPVTNQMSWENDSVKFTFKPTKTFWGVTIENKTNVKMSCIWDNALFVVNKQSSPLLFDNTLIINKSASKGESQIASKTEISKSIYPFESYVKDGRNYVSDLFFKAGIKYYGDTSIRLIFPIKSGEKTREYEFEFKVSICSK